MVVDRLKRVKAPRLASYAVVLFSSARCAEPETTEPGADAVVYVEAYCSELCDKAEACGPVSDPHWNCADFDDCFDPLLRRLEEESCMAQLLEFGRCRAERLTCEEYLDLHVETLPGSVCFDRWEALVECSEQHPDEYR